MNLLAVDDGIVNGNLDLADMLFFAAFVVFVVLAILLATAGPARLVAVLSPIGLALLALGWFVL